MWYKNRTWIQKTNKLVECKHNGTSKNKEAKMENILQKRTNESYINYKIQRENVKEMAMNTKKRSWEEFGEKMEKDGKRNQKLLFKVLKSLRKETSKNTKQTKNKKGDILRKEKEIMNRWKEYFEELLNVKCERQVGDDEEEDSEEQKEEMGDEGIRIEEVMETINMKKGGKAAGHDNIEAEMLQNMEENGLEILYELFNKTLT